MTAIIKPKKGLTRVGRNDIYWNLESIRDAVEYITDVQFSHNIWYSSGIGKTEEEKQAMERNYNKLQTEVWRSIFTPMKREVSASLKKLQGYYDHEVVDYENKDDSYKLKAVKVRYQYSSVWELFKQNGIDYVESNWKLIKGAVMAVVDLLKGLYSIGNMIYYYNSGKTAAIVMLISPDPPKWAEETLGESEDYFGNMTKAITHPVETLEAMAQNLNDTYEVEGLEYMGGYVIGDIVVGEISAAAVSKAVGKGAGAVDDIGNIANKADDVADIAETAGKSGNYSTSTYDGVRQASEYLKQQGVPRQYRKQIIESFDVRTIKLETAGDSTYGLRFYGGNANAEGRYLFETFSPLTNRNNLALPYEWNSMTGIQQFQVKKGTKIITGAAAPQTSFGSQYLGGAHQWYINDLEDLIKCQ